MRYTAILFDMDGVVVDTHQAVTAFWQQVAALPGSASLRLGAIYPCKKRTY